MQGTSQDDDHSHDDGCLLNVYVPGTDQNALCELSHLILARSRSLHYYLHLADEKTEAH